MRIGLLCFLFSQVAISPVVWATSPRPTYDGRKNQECLEKFAPIFKQRYESERNPPFEVFQDLAWIPPFDRNDRRLVFLSRYGKMSVHPEGGAACSERVRDPKIDALFSAWYVKAAEVEARVLKTGTRMRPFPVPLKDLLDCRNAVSRDTIPDELEANATRCLEFLADPKGKKTFPACESLAKGKPNEDFSAAKTAPFGSEAEGREQKCLEEISRNWTKLNPKPAKDTHTEFWPQAGAAMVVRKGRPTVVGLDAQVTLDPYDGKCQWRRPDGEGWVNGQDQTLWDLLFAQAWEDMKPRLTMEENGQTVLPLHEYKKARAMKDFGDNLRTRIEESSRLGVLDAYACDAIESLPKVSDADLAKWKKKRLEFLDSPAWDVLQKCQTDLLGPNDPPMETEHGKKMKRYLKCLADIADGGTFDPHKSLAVVCGEESERRTINRPVSGLTLDPAPTVPAPPPSNEPKPNE